MGMGLLPEVQLICVVSAVPDKGLQLTVHLTNHARKWKILGKGSSIQFPVSVWEHIQYTLKLLIRLGTHWCVVITGKYLTAQETEMVSCQNRIRYNAT